MTPANTAAESGVVLVTKAIPPVSVSLATIFGIQVSEIVLWATLIYTCLLIAHKLIAIFRDIKGPGD